MIYKISYIMIYYVMEIYVMVLNLERAIYSVFNNHGIIDGFFEV